MEIIIVDPPAWTVRFSHLVRPGVLWPLDLVHFQKPEIVVYWYVTTPTENFGHAMIKHADGWRLQNLDRPRHLGGFENFTLESKPYDSPDDLAASCSDDLKKEIDCLITALKLKGYS